MAVWTEFSLPLYTRSNETSVIGVLVGGVIGMLAALDTAGKDDVLTCGRNGGIWIIDEGLSLGTLALSLAVILHIEPYFCLFNNIDGLQFGKCQGKDEQEGKEEEHRWC